MTDSGFTENPRVTVLKGVEPCAALIWMVVCASYWLYPLWPRGNVNWNLKFGLLAAHAVLLLGGLRWWSTRFAQTPGSLAIDSWRTALASRWGIATLTLIAVIGTLQYSELRLLITSGTDEPYRIMAALEQWRALSRSSAGAGVVAGVFISVGLLCFSGLLLLSRERRSWRWLGASGALFAVSLAVHHETALTLGSAWGSSPRWPPVGTLFEVASLACFGAGETSARLPSLVFFLLTGVYLFRLVWLDSPGVPAFAAAAFGLTAPAFVLQGQLASREPGGVFFLTAAAFYLARWWRSHSDRDLGLTLTMVLAGYLVRRPVIVFAGVVIVVAAADLWRRRRSDSMKEIRHALLLWAGGLALIVIAAAPWAFTSRTIRPFDLFLANWRDLAIVLAYPVRFPAAAGLVATVAASVGILSLLRHPRVTVVIAALWLAALYVLFTSDTPQYIPTWRFLGLMSAPLAVLAAGGLRELADRLPARVRIALAGVIIIGVVWPLAAWYTCAPPLPWRSEVPCRDNVPRYPFDDVVAWYQARTHEPVVVSPVTYWQTALDPYLVLAAAEGIEEYVPPYGTPAPPLTAEDLAKACRSTPADALVVPFVEESGGRLPLFMAGDGRGVTERFATLGFGDGVEFVNGRHELVLYPCPQPSGSNELEAPSGDHDHFQQEPTP